ncbi:beta-N-acetylhexosaminidase [Clostridium folliculivorans]|uniref:beta-N-acetylhexosaminidase n=1 Tax=Clostridium folliculivorans TaxID=2886038 RepID=UPI0021C469A4|nr:beta-N-acetylhexosaminidase [Clostridium folliculivorans]GKU28529.1 glycoside hydrolase family 3 [Clostridium folliculivorans]
MRKFLVVLAIIFIILIAFVGGYYIGGGKMYLDKFFSRNNPSYINKGSSNNSSNINTPIDEKDPIKEKLKSLTLDEKIGQLTIVGIEGTEINDNTKELIKNYHVGGVIFFKENISSRNQALALVQSLKNINGTGIPLFLGVDEEGGRVSRMPAEYKKLPSSGTIGKKNNEDISKKVGEILGEEVSSVGFNLDFAPVLDINSNPKNPIIGDRSFGNNAELVSKLGVATMNGIQSKNIISAVKHFPGHGDTLVDSHKGLPTVNNDINRLRSFELIPFKEAIDNGADMVMVAHILLPNIDKTYPSSLSKVVISDLLRKELGFNGVIITDDMTMGAITLNYDINKAAVTSLKAGSDIVLVCHDYNKEKTVIESIKTAVNNKEITEQEIDEKVYRILKLKDKYKIGEEKQQQYNIQDINNKITSILK